MNIFWTLTFFAYKYDLFDGGWYDSFLEHKHGIFIHMSTVKAIFVQATYVLVTFVNISNISAVIGPIFGQPFFDKNICFTEVF